MKTSIWIIILSVILCGVILLCPFLTPAEITETEEIQVLDLSDVVPDEEDYIQYEIVMLDGPAVAPNIKLYPKEKTFEFMIHPLSSYLPTGHYNIENGKLTLDCDTDDNVYVFSLTPLKQEQTDPDYETVEGLRLSYLNFLADESTPLPMIKESASANEATLPFSENASFIPVTVVITTK